MGCRVAGRPDAELRVSLTGFLFDARIQPQSFQRWKRPANTAWQHLSQVFIILLEKKEHPEVIHFNLIDRGRFEKEHSALILSDLHIWGSDRSE